MPSPKLNVSVDGNAIDAAILTLLSRLEVRESEEDATVAALRFTLNQAPDGSYSPLDDNLFAPSVKLGIQVEAPGSTTVHLFNGYVTHVRPHFETIEANCYLEIMAMDAAVLLAAEERVAAYPNSSDSDAAKEVFDRYQITFDGQSTAARWEEDRQLLVQRANDWEFVRSLARRNGFICYLEPDPASGQVSAHFKPRGVKDTPQADLAILREGVNLKWLDIQFLANGPTKFKSAAIDPLNKQLIRSDGAPQLDPLGDSLLDSAIEGGLTREGATSAAARFFAPSGAEAALGAETSAATDRALFAVEARGELDPALYRGLLRARRPVLIKGVGRMFAGAYWVKAVRTTIDQGNISQTFVAERNAIGLSGSESFGGQAEEVPAE